MAKDPGAISGKQLIKLLQRDGWVVGRKTNHGLSLSKMGEDGHKRVTIIPDKGGSLPPGTLAAILGPLQTGIGREGLSARLRSRGRR